MIERYHHFDGALLTVMMIFHEAGDVVGTHVHNADHTLTLTVGEIEVTEEGETYVMKAPALATIPSGVEHGIRALSAGSIATCALLPRDTYGRPLTGLQMAGMTAFELWQAQERV